MSLDASSKIFELSFLPPFFLQIHFKAVHQDFQFQNSTYILNYSTHVLLFSSSILQPGKSSTRAFFFSLYNVGRMGSCWKVFCINAAITEAWLLDLLLIKSFYLWSGAHHVLFLQKRELTTWSDTHFHLVIPPVDTCWNLLLNWFFLHNKVLCNIGECKFVL